MSKMPLKISLEMMKIPKFLSDMTKELDGRTYINLIEKIGSAIGRN